MCANGECWFSDSSEFDPADDSVPDRLFFVGVSVTQHADVDFGPIVDANAKSVFARLQVLANRVSMRRRQ